MHLTFAANWEPCCSSMLPILPLIPLVALHVLFPALKGSAVERLVHGEGCCSRESPGGALLSTHTSSHPKSNVFTTTHDRTARNNFMIPCTESLRMGKNDNYGRMQYRTFTTSSNGAHLKIKGKNDITQFEFAADCAAAAADCAAGLADAAVLD
eukprot:970464-Pelagomonas_calceolata.AAC.1